MDFRPSQEVPMPRPSRAIDVRGTRRTMMRVMHRKSVGVVAVYEQDPVAGQNVPRALVFETPGGRTQVTEFPNEWQRLSDDELAQMRRDAS